jgi:cytochrome c peroxidase
MDAVLKQAQIAPVVPGIPAKLTPRIIPQTLLTADGAGVLGTHQPGGATTTSGNAFFTPLGSPNGRSCFTCHQPQTGWSFTPVSAQTVFLLSAGKDPLFAPVDGMNCPNLNPTTLAQRALASSQVLTRGNIRIGLPIPTQHEWAQIKIVRDPTRCENDATFGLPSGVLNMYRRPLNSTNLTINGQLNFLSNPPAVIPEGAIMWDGREPTLESQFIDATMGHAQASRPTDAQIAQGVLFEKGISTAQYRDAAAGLLSASGATGGPVNLAALAASEAAAGVTFILPNPGEEVVDLYDAWSTPPNAGAASIKRGQDIFNNRLFAVRGVAGFNEFFGGGPVNASCATCHNNKNVASDVINVGFPGPSGTFPEGRHLGVGDNSGLLDESGDQTEATALPPASDMPLFEFWCPVGSIHFYSNPQTGADGSTYDVFQTSDPGVALITGKCNDLGKFKVPRLRGLAARAPYFHGGEASSLNDVVRFYDIRFSMGLTAQDKQDLVNFLNAL